MDYMKIYDSLVEKCKTRGLDKSILSGYYEKHHILPKCLGGSDEDSNFVLFDVREHIVAHRLLWKANPSNHSLMWAYVRTVRGRSGEYQSSRRTKAVREAVNLYMKNREVSQETRDKISKTLTGRKIPKEVVEKARRSNTGRKRSEKTKELLRQKRKELIESGWRHSEESRRKISEASKGREVSESVRKALSEANKGKIISEKHKAVLSEYQKSLKPWERSKVKSSEHRLFKWLHADTIYSIWHDSGSPGSTSLATIVNNKLGTTFSESYFSTIISFFREGWAPSEDNTWLDFIAQNKND